MHAQPDHHEAQADEDPFLAEIHVRKGQEVVLEISTADVQQGFLVKGLDIDESVQPGKPALVSFTSDKSG